jgi:hypothetical protein
MRTLFAQVSVSPDANALPGSAQIQQIVNGLAAFALLGLVGSLIVGAVIWAIGSASASYGQVSKGKTMVLFGLVGSLIVGAAAALVNFFQALGGRV